MARTNLIPNPSAFVNGLPSFDGWTSLGDGDLSFDSASAYFGGTSFKITNESGSAGAGMRSASPITVSSEQVYSISVYAYIPAFQPTTTQDTPLRLSVDWYDAGDVLLSSNVSDVVNVLADSTWSEKRLTLIENAPATATKAYVSVRQEAIGVKDQVFLLDGWLMEAEPYIGEFFNNFTQAQENSLVNRALTAVPFPNITGMQLNADIAIADLVLNTIDELGTVWVCTEIDGWWTSASPEVPNITRGTEDGSYDISGRYAAREITLSGVFVPQDPANIQVARDKLIRAINLVRKSAWLRTDEKPTRASKVWLVGQPQIQTVNARGRTEFSIPLRAPDPVKYLWNDESQDGTELLTAGANQSVSLENEGNTRVTGYLELAGPLGAGSTVNSTSKFSEELITTAFSLRGAGTICDIIEVSRSENVVTLVTEYISGAEVGDVLELSNVTSPEFAPRDGVITVTSVSNESPYAFTYEYAGADSSSRAITATARLLTADVLGIDTYNQTVVFNNDASGHRSKLEPLVDWFKFEEGYNDVDFRENIVPYKVRKKSYETLEFSITNSVRAGTKVTLTTSTAHNFIVGYPVIVTGTTASTGAFNGSWTITEVTSNTFSFTHTTSGNVATGADSGLATVSLATLVFDRAHQLGVGESIAVALPESRDIITKSLTSNVATLTTEEPHGYAVGDKITVQVTTLTPIASKKVVLDSPAPGTDTVTIGTSGAHGISTGDIVQVALPLTATITGKSATTGAVTLTTSQAHGFSVGDVVSIAMPITNFVVKKKAVDDVVTLHTQTPHNFSEKDVINVALPTSASFTSKTITPSTVTLGTSSAHGFSTGDSVTLTLPVTRNIDSYRFGGSTTVGEYYTVTITTTAAHGYDVGDKITVAAVTNTGSNGTYYIESVPSPTTFTYLYYESNTAIAEAGSETGTVTNVTNQTITDADGTATKTLTATTSTTMTYAR
jgi:hypothetical protein